MKKSVEELREALERITYDEPGKPADVAALSNLIDEVEVLREVEKIINPSGEVMKYGRDVVLNNALKHLQEVRGE